MIALGMVAKGMQREKGSPDNLKRIKRMLITNKRCFNPLFVAALWTLCWNLKRHSIAQKKSLSHCGSPLQLMTTMVQLMLP